MENSKRRGSITELLVIAKLLEYGEVSIPYGNNARYDCILDLQSKLVRIQIKTAKVIDDNRFRIPFANTKTTSHESVRKVYTPDSVDYIATYYCGNVYLVPTGKYKNLFTLCFDYPKNGIKSTINIEKEYRIENVLKHQ